MSAPRRPFNPDLLVDNSHGFRVIPEDLLERDAGLYIDYDDASWIGVFVGGRAINDPLGQSLQAKVKINRHELQRRIKACCEVWQTEVVDRLVRVHIPEAQRARDERPYQADWDVRAMISDDDLRRIGARLAIAGRNLFRFLFMERERGNELHAIGEALVRRSREREMVVTITSSRLFLPWPMIYTHIGPGDRLYDDGSNFNWQGFWGYRHIVEHATDRQMPRVRIEPGSDGKVTFSYNADTRLNDQYPGNLETEQWRYFGDFEVLSVTPRRVRSEFEKAILAANCCDQIHYFFCHHIGAGERGDTNLEETGLALSDGSQISAVDVENWLNGRDLMPGPLVLINACQGGHPTTLFYDTLARKFLERSALGVIGPWVSVPPKFADQHMRQFFDSFMPRNGDLPMRAGHIARDVSRRFIDEYRNPLGLTYSLYRALDCYVPRRYHADEGHEGQ